MNAGAAYSIRKRLLLVLGLLITVASATETVISYRRATHEVDAMADAQMAQVARALRRDRGDHDPAVFQINEGNRAIGSFRVQLTPHPDPAAAPALRDWGGPLRAFSDTTIDGKPYRVFTTFSRSHKIEVMHDMDLRAAGARALAVHIMLPFIIISPLLLLAVWLSISIALRPLFVSRSEIGKRDANDLSPLATAGVPMELLPFVEEINALFERVSAAFNAQKNFVADAAHELRSPLAALRLQVQALQKAGNDEARQLAAERVTSGIDRASRLLEQMLILAREEAAENELQSVSLLDLSRLAIADSLPLAQARSIDLGADLPPDSDQAQYQLEGHREALRIMLGNLLDNAIKYSPAGGIVDIRLYREPSALLLSIEDSGPGIPPDQREKVFERFHRSSETSQQATGSGLGLAIVRAIAERHHIRIVFEDSGSLGGLKVLLCFPLNPD